MAQHEISFDCTTDQRGLAFSIAARAYGIRQQALLEQPLRGRPASHRSQIDIAMDLIAAHANGCPIDFERLLAADNFNLAHDVFGIEQHLDRETGKLLNCFVPRFAAKESVSA